MASGVLMIHEGKRERLESDGIAFIRKQFLSAAITCEGDHVVLYQSGRSRLFPPGYFAVAILAEIEVYAQDPRFFYVRLSNLIPFRDHLKVRASGPVVESTVRNSDGTLAARSFSKDIRTLTPNEFREIVGGRAFIQNSSAIALTGAMEGERTYHQRTEIGRSKALRQKVLEGYRGECAFTRQRLLSADGLKTGLIACHHQDVGDRGPDHIANLSLFCPDFHTRYDQGTIDILDDYTWVPVGPNQDDIILNWIGPRKIFVPDDPSLRPAPQFLAAHRRFRGLG